MPYRHRRVFDQQLREDQDVAYQQSLAADREKERLKQEVLEKGGSHGQTSTGKAPGGKETKRSQYKFLSIRHYVCVCL